MGIVKRNLYEPTIRLRRCLRQVSSRGSNEGTIIFRRDAYEQVLEFSAVDINDCDETIRDVKNIFSDVARHELNDHNAAVDRDEKEKKISAADMPGMNPDKIQVVRFLDRCLLPTDVVTGDGTIRLNENFVRLLFLMSMKGMRGKTGRIEDWPRTTQRRFLGELYASIIYSLALHTIRGHFPINEWGFALFDSNEATAQVERGRKHAYVNVLAMLFYWLYCVEHCPRPDLRLEVFMVKHPEVFARLSKDEIRKLPEHLEALFWDFAGKNKAGKRVFPIKISNKPTGLTHKDIAEVMSKYPNPVSNEGGNEHNNTSIAAPKG